MAEDLNSIGHHPNPPTWDVPQKVIFTSGAPNQPSWDGQYAFDRDTLDLYLYTNGAWVLTASGGGGGGGANEVITGSSDPVGAPAAGVVIFCRTDVNRTLYWNGSAWVVIASEI